MGEALKYGIYDTVDQLWMGNERGVVLYDDVELAMVSARIVDVRLSVFAGRHRAMPWQPATIRQRDSVDTRMSTLEALVRLEEGRV